MDLVRRSGNVCDRLKVLSVIIFVGIHWGRGLMAFCVSLVELKVCSFKENKSGSLSTREPLILIMIDYF